MKYTITINQKAITDNKMDIDIVDAAVFDFIKDFIHTPKCQKMQTDIGDYFWISHNLVISNMPMIGIKTKAGIINRIKHLEDAELLERHPNCKQMGRTYYKLGRMYEATNFVDTSKQPYRPPLNESIDPPLNGCLDYNSISNDNNISYNKGEVTEIFKKSLILPWDTEHFKSCWLLWKEYKKKEKGFKYKSLVAEQAALKKLSRLSDENEEIGKLIIIQSIENGWSGFFELKTVKKNGSRLSTDQQEYLADRTDI